MIRKLVANIMYAVILFKNIRFLVMLLASKIRKLEFVCHRFFDVLLIYFLLSCFFTSLLSISFSCVSFSFLNLAVKFFLFVSTCNFFQILILFNFAVSFTFIFNLFLLNLQLVVHIIFILYFMFYYILIVRLESLFNFWLFLIKFFDLFLSFYFLSFYISFLPSHLLIS